MSSKKGRRRTAAKSARLSPTIQQIIDATPERLAKGDHSDFVNPAEIDSAEQPIGLTRRFKSSHLDRLHNNGKLTWVQWYAGDWYRNTHHRARFALSVVASYGDRINAAPTPTAFGYGLPQQEAQIRARTDLAKARQQWPRDMIGYMDRLLIHDELPRYGGRAAARNIAQIRNALDNLAGWLRIGT